MYKENNPVYYIPLALNITKKTIKSMLVDSG